MVAIDSTSTTILGLIGISITLILTNLAFNSFSDTVPSEADRSFERTANRIENFCQNKNTASKNVLLEVPERGNITFNGVTMTGWGGKSSDGNLRKLGPRELDCSYIELEDSDSTIVNGETKRLEKIEGIEKSSIRIK